MTYEEALEIVKVAEYYKGGDMMGLLVLPPSLYEEIKEAYRVKEEKENSLSGLNGLLVVCPAEKGC